MKWQFCKEKLACSSYLLRREWAKNMLKAIAKHFNQETAMYIKHTYDVFFIKMLSVFLYFLEFARIKF